MLEIQQGKEEDEDEEEEGSTTQHKVDTKSLDVRLSAQTQTTPQFPNCCNGPNVLRHQVAPDDLIPIQSFRSESKI